MPDFDDDFYWPNENQWAKIIESIEKKHPTKRMDGKLLVGVEPDPADDDEIPI